MHHKGGFAIASGNFYKYRGANAWLARAVTAVNSTLIELYWSIGQYISRKAAKDGWGTGTVAELSRTIQRKYPGMTGFSLQNLWRMRQFYEVYQGQAKLSPLVRVLSWTHNLIILSRGKGKEEREFYLRLVRFITPCMRNHHIKNILEK
jgi:predicted nuclease of restriction endonuclease-like (RecB) superfamily